MPREGLNTTGDTGLDREIDALWGMIRQLQARLATVEGAKPASLSQPADAPVGGGLVVTSVSGLPYLQNKAGLKLDDSAGLTVTEDKDLAKITLPFMTTDHETLAPALTSQIAQVFNAPASYGVPFVQFNVGGTSIGQVGYIPSPGVMRWLFASTGATTDIISIRDAATLSYFYLRILESGAIQWGNGTSSFTATIELVRTANAQLTLRKMTFGTLTTPTFIVQGIASQTGSLVELSGVSSTAAIREMVDFDAVWVDNTDATRKARGLLYAFDTARREAVRWEADGSAARLGFYGAAAVAKGTVTGSRGGNAALASLLTALANLGLVTDSSTA